MQELQFQLRLGEISVKTSKLFFSFSIFSFLKSETLPCSVGSFVLQPSHHYSLG